MVQVEIRRSSANFFALDSCYLARDCASWRRSAPRFLLTYKLTASLKTALGWSQLWWVGYPTGSCQFLIACSFCILQAIKNWRCRRLKWGYLIHQFGQGLLPPPPLSHSHIFFLHQQNSESFWPQWPEGMHKLEKRILMPELVSPQAHHHVCACMMLLMPSSLSPSPSSAWCTSGWRCSWGSASCMDRTVSLSSALCQVQSVSLASPPPPPSPS